MDVREKLVELLDEAEEWANHECDELDCETCQAGKMRGNCFQQLMVGRLIDNGVTVQEWISVKDRLPEPGKQVLIYSRYDFCESAFYIGVPGKWRVTWNHEMLDADSVTHWMQMPNPPKGE